MIRQKYSLLAVILSILTAVSCTPSSGEPTQSSLGPQSIPETISNGNDRVEDLAQIPAYHLIQPEELVYQGYFRLPEGSGASDWDYSGQGLTYNPAGDPGGEGDGYPGSLFGFGHDHQLYVSEISIPQPVLSSTVADAPTATTLQAFRDITGGIFAAEEMTIPRGGLALLTDPEPRLFFTFGQHFQDFEPSHGSASLDLAHVDAAGAWIFGEYSNYVSNDYLFEIPPNWAEAIGPGPLLASGRAREGLWSGRGPALFSYQPVGSGNPPAPGGIINGILPMMLYGEQLPGQPDIVSEPSQAVLGYQEADHWWGGAWLTAGEKAAVVFSGTKAVGQEWYGFANGVVWEHDCAEQQPPTCPDVPAWPYDDRGFWADDFRAELIFFDPGDLAAAARGEMKSWEPQPYAALDLDGVLLAPDLNLEIYKRDLVGAMAFDRGNGLIYIVERLADEYRSVIHVWKITP